MMGKVIMSGVVPQLVAPSIYIGDPVFANNDWATIIEACQMNAVPDTWEVGDQKPMTINGTSYAIDIIGKNHDDYAEGSGKAPLTFQIHDIYPGTPMMHNTNYNTMSWEGCNMRTTHLPSILALMPSEVQAGIKEVSKLTSAGNKSTTIKTTKDKLFLLSEVEVFGTTTYSKSGEGVQYDYYKAGNSKIKNMNGSAYNWWERSPHGSDDMSFCIVDRNGGVNYGMAAAYAGAAFAFCF